MERLWCCAEIHEAVKQGDYVKVEALLQENPKLVSIKDDTTVCQTPDAIVIDFSYPIPDNAPLNHTPLHLAVAFCNQGDCKDVIELLRLHGGQE